MVVINEPGLSIPMRAHVRFPMRDQRKQRIEYMIEQGMSVEEANADEDADEASWKYTFEISWPELVEPKP